MKFNIKDAILVLADIKKVETVESKPMSNVKKGKGKERERPIDNRDLYWDIFRTDPLVGWRVYEEGGRTFGEDGI